MSIILRFARALALRCPNCGARSLFASRFRLRRACEWCEMRLERDTGDFTGSMTINLVVTEAVWALSLAAILIATWPTPPVALLQWGSIGLMIVFPILFFPWSKTLWLALDLTLRPHTRRSDPTGSRSIGR